MSGNDTFVTLSNVKRRKVEWFWRPYIPFGMLTILQGDPGLGKSFLSMYLAAVISTGGGKLLDNSSDDFDLYRGKAPEHPDNLRDIIPLLLFFVQMIPSHPQCCERKLLFAISRNKLRDEGLQCLTRGKKAREAHASAKRVIAVHAGASKRMPALPKMTPSAIRERTLRPLTMLIYLKSLKNYGRGKGTDVEPSLASELVIGGHMKQDGLLERNALKGTEGDVISVASPRNGSLRGF